MSDINKNLGLVEWIEEQARETVDLRIDEEVSE